VLLAATITVFSFPGAEFGPSIVARPIWALILLHTWQIIGQGRHRAWAALSVEIGLLVLTTSAALPLLTMLAVFVLATQKGRRALASMDALYAAIVTLVLVLPYLVWLIRADMVLLPALARMGAVAGSGAGVGRVARRFAVRVIGCSTVADRQFARAGPQERRSAADFPSAGRPSRGSISMSSRWCRRLCSVSSPRCLTGIRSSAAMVLHCCLRGSRSSSSRET
jgi:vacuolar-type H+-ATPase subunit I/STV1